MNDIKTIRPDNKIDPAGVGFVVIPADLDREKYLEICYRTYTVSINAGLGYGMWQNVRCPIDVLQLISFPENHNERGSAVAWIRENNNNRPTIVNVFQDIDDYYVLGENKFRRTVKTENNVVDVLLDGENSELQINILGDKNSPSKVNVKLNSENQDSELNVYSDNIVSITSDKKVIINTSGEFTVNAEENGIIKGMIDYTLGNGLIVISEKNVITQINDDDQKTIAKISYEKDNGFSYEDEFSNTINIKDRNIKIDVSDSGLIKMNCSKLLVTGDIIASDGVKNISLINHFHTAPTGITKDPVPVPLTKTL